MTSTGQHIDDLFASPDVPVSNGAYAHEPNEGTTLRLTMDNRQWLEFIANGWWLVGQQPIRMGVGVPLDSAAEGHRIRVVAVVKPAMLGPFDAVVWSGTAWIRKPLQQLDSSDCEVSWGVPIPLSAIEAFIVGTEADRSRLLGMAKGFANVEVPPQPIHIQEYFARTPEASVPLPIEIIRPPAAWDAMRGAAAMALWAVPRIRPWIDLLRLSLSGDTNQQALLSTEAFWWSCTPWSKSPPDLKASGIDDALWRAALQVFRGYPAERNWRPSELLEEICLVADGYGGDKKALREFSRVTSRLLHDEQRASLTQDAGPVALAIQLVLLRPAPAQFVSWKDEPEPISPATWWSGAVLSGLLFGFKGLEPEFRGAQLVRDFGARQVWLSNVYADSRLREWLDTERPLELRLTCAKAYLSIGEDICAEYKLSRRGRWYEADLDDKRIQSAALQVARRFCSAAICQRIELRDVSLTAHGEGSLSVIEGRRIDVTGQVVLELPPHVRAVNHLDHEHFRRWVAVGEITEALPPPPSDPSQVPASDAMPSEGLVAVPVPGVPGLLKVFNFISEDEERTLVKHVDSADWLSDLSRRVQHYGWRYDYKARGVNAGAYLGPLPGWLACLADRLFKAGLVAEMPDQVIVNEYVGKQGISKHVDCPECFRGNIVTVSLVESWEMLFRGPAGSKEGVLLDQRSAVIIGGPARAVWTHEIPKRLRELGRVRDRRVSLTFRKVNADLK